MPAADDRFQCAGCGCECPVNSGCGCDCPCCEHYFVANLPLIEVS